MTQPTPDRPVHVDDSWKQQAQQEKDTLSGGQASAGTPGAGAQAGSPSAGAGQRPQLPPPSFESIVEQYLTHILLSLGAIPHPATGKRTRDLEVAKHYIDTLAILQAKTKGNLTAEEQQLLDNALYQVRMAYVQATGAK